LGDRRRDGCRWLAIIMILRSEHILCVIGGNATYEESSKPVLAEMKRFDSASSCLGADTGSTRCYRNIGRIDLDLQDLSELEKRRYDILSLYIAGICDYFQSVVAARLEMRSSPYRYVAPTTNASPEVWW
jgi:hypothetical protein